MDPLWRNPGLEGETARERERVGRTDGFACIVSEEGKGPTDRATDRGRPSYHTSRRRPKEGRERERWALINGHSPSLREWRAGGGLHGREGR